MEGKRENRLTKKELRQIFLRYGVMTESAMSYEKMHGATWAYSYLPLGEKYYKDDPEAFKRLLTRHSVFYNTEPQTGQLVSRNWGFGNAGNTCAHTVIDCYGDVYWR